jgi:hypothetical protein
MSVTNSRGFRNKNPGNIDYNERNKWQGQVGIEPTGNPPRFAVFESHEFGIRALVVLLNTYQDRHGLRTISGIINRWAPPNENSTGSYASHVARLTGFGLNDRLDLHTYEHAEPLVKAIITHELGGQPYDQRTIDEGLRRAGIMKHIGTLREAAATGTGQGAITSGTLSAAAGAIGTAAAGMQGLDWKVAVALVLALAVAAVVFVLARRKE